MLNTKAKGRHMKEFVEYVIQFTQNKLNVQAHRNTYQHLRKRIEGVIYYLKSGCSLRLMPPHYGSKSPLIHNVVLDTQAVPQRDMRTNMAIHGRICV